MGVKSVLQTKPADFSRVNKLQLQVLQKDTFTSSLRKSNIILTPTISSYTPLKPSEYNLFKKQIQIFKNNNLEGLEMVKHLSTKQKMGLIKRIGERSMENFVLFATGNKPSILLDKIPEAITIKDIDIVSLSNSVVLPSGKKLIFDHSFLLNRNLVKNVIKENFDIYQKRLKLDKNASIDEVYNVLIDKNTLSWCQAEAPDIHGLTLGFPRDSSLIFTLNNGKDNQIFKNQELIKGTLKQALFSENSPYKDFDNKFKEHLLTQIDKINPSHSGEKLNTGADAYAFKAFVEEPEAFSKILTGIRKTCVELIKINKNVNKTF